MIEPVDGSKRIRVIEPSSRRLTVRRQDIWLRSRRRLAEDRPRLGVDVRRLACGVASAGRVPQRGVTEGSKPAAARAFHMAL